MITGEGVERRKDYKDYEYVDTRGHEDREARLRRWLSIRQREQQGHQEWETYFGHQKSKERK